MTSRIQQAVVTVVYPLAIVAFALSRIAPLAAQEVKTLEDVLRVWREREQATRSLEFDIASDFLTGIGPSKPTKEKERRVLVIDGSKMRHQRIATVWNDAVDAGVPEVTTSVFDGSMKKSLYHPDRSDHLVFPLGWIYKSKEHSDINSIYLSPILKHYRPLALGIIKIDGLRLASTDETVDGIPCVLIEEALPESARIAKYWVAPGQDMAIVRFTRQFRGKDELHLEASFKKNPVHGWMPHRWIAARYGTGRKVIDSTTEVVTTSAINTKVSAELFDLTFPPGTVVYNGVIKQNFIAQDDGTLRPVDSNEITPGRKRPRR